ncbi:MAG: hypothetical protein AUH85_09685 [Chloroflexi bacterium 13_1_40CM_4_68_4]|nr:MAG: hypothetical protein AUH85_09685 [Chloroflexi bacterium 13_1_40CM_4_68_4]
MKRWVRPFFATARLWLRFMATDRFMLFCVFFQPFFIAVTVMYMLRHQPSFDPVYVVVGSGLTGIWSVVLFDGTWAVQSERGYGTLELVVGSPASMAAIVAGKLAAGVVFSLTSMAFCYGIGAWLFGYEIAVREPAPFLVALVLAIVSLGAMGVLLAPLAILARAIGRFFTILEHPVYIFGGFLFPILLLPGWLHPVSYALPPYWAAVALHGTSSGDLGGVELLGVCAALIGSSVACILLALPFFRLVERRARVDGSLALT